MTFFVCANSATPTNAQLVAAARRLGIESLLTAPADVVALARPGDVVLSRLDVLRSLDGVEEGTWELARLERNGIRVLNPLSALLAAHDKLMTALRLARVGVPHPRTAHVDEASQIPDLELPVVVKPRFGSWGDDVFLCRTRRALGRRLRRLRGRPWFQRQGALVQELVRPRGYDVRLVVAQGEVVGGIERRAAAGEWRTNVALGGRRRPAAPTAEAKAIAIAAAAASGCDLVGVDLLPRGPSGYVVIELNGAVDFTEEYAFDGADAFEAAVGALLHERRPAALALGSA